MIEHTCLVNVVFLTELVKGDVHGVEHTHDFHWSQAGTHGCETDYVTEEDADDGELFAGVERSLPISQLVSNWFGHHLEEKSVCSLDAFFKLGTADFLLCVLYCL